MVHPAGARPRDRNGADRFRWPDSHDAGEERSAPGGVAAVGQSVDAAELLDEFVTLRTGSITFVEGLRDVDLVRGGWHPDIGYVLVVDLLHEWVYHDHDHIRQMMANVQRYLWPHLGSTQKFYGA